MCAAKIKPVHISRMNLPGLGRCQVLFARGPLKNLKPENFTQEGLELPTQAEFRSKKYQHCVVWPVAGDRSQSSLPVPIQDIPVSAFSDWPANDQDEIPFLKSKLAWKNPCILGGLTERGKAKPTFMMYYDAQDTRSQPNIVAQGMQGLLPCYEREKVRLPRDGMRGVVVLVYSPMTSVSEMGSTQSGQPGAQFSLEQMRELVHFHTTEAAREMYASHDNPMHRMFGGLSM